MIEHAKTFESTLMRLIHMETRANIFRDPAYDVSEHFVSFRFSRAYLHSSRALSRTNITANDTRLNSLHLVNIPFDKIKNSSRSDKKGEKEK